MPYSFILPSAYPNFTTMDKLLTAIEEACFFLKQKNVPTPVAGIVLGTGLGALVDHIDIAATIPYHEIPHFPVSTVEFHKGQLLFGKLGNTPVVVMQGRFHYYEGYSMQEVSFPVRVMHKLGIKHLLLSNAAGGLNPWYKKGDLIIIDDHINMLPDNPLRGLNNPVFGNRFVDMSCPYDKNLNSLLKKGFELSSIHVKEGVYVAVIGPNLETRAEYRWLRGTGADMVGMSTVPEVITAGHLGLPCAAVSVITDECDPDHLEPVNIADIIAVAGKADKTLSTIFEYVITSLQEK